jgi:hypothetical protein
MLSLKEYLDLSEKVIYKYGKFLPSEDDISYVAEFMMRADVRYKEGIGKREMFRVFNGKFAVMILIKKHKNKWKKSGGNEVLSLDFVFDKDPSIRRLDIPDKKQKTPDFTFEYNELITFINSTDIFTAIEKELLLDFISSNCSYRNSETIRNKLGIKYSGYKKIIKKALTKIGYNYV